MIRSNNTTRFPEWCCTDYCRGCDGDAITVSFLATTGFVVADTYEIDPVHTQVLLTVSHQGLPNSNGALIGPVGTFKFDEKEFSKSSVEVTIQSNEIDMDNKNGMWVYPFTQL